MCDPDRHIIKVTRRDFSCSGKLIHHFQRQVIIHKNQNQTNKNSRRPKIAEIMRNMEFLKSSFLGPLSSVFNFLNFFVLLCVVRLMKKI